MSSDTDTDIHVHTHSHSELDVPVSSRHRKILLSGVASILLVISVVLIFTWPSSSVLSDTTREVRETIDFPSDQRAAVVDSQRVEDCEGQEELPEADRMQCLRVLFDVKSGEVEPDEGRPCQRNQPFNDDPSNDLRYCVLQTFEANSTTTPRFALGQNVVVSYRKSEGVDPQFRYQYADHDRRLILLSVVALFLAAVLIFGAWRGFRAVLGLVVSLIVIGIYVLPALVSGENGFVVALAGGTLVAAFALYLAHGINPSTHIAFISSIGSVLSIAVLAQIFFMLGNFSGFVSEEASYLSAGGTDIDLRGLLVAGVILATLGALDDMTVTQVAAVSEMHNARPDYRFSQLWKSALRIGRDHVASTVNTLALAYVGTSLALMMIFVISQQGLMWIANSEAVAVQIVGALVGSIGLIISVPMSTALAAYAVHHSGEHDRDDEDEHQEKSVETN